MTSKSHWEHVYGAKAPSELSWYQPEPTTSLALLDQLGIGPATSLIDVGGGASTLVDALIERGLRRITVLDISGAALDHARARLGPRGSSVTWIEDDVTGARLPAAEYDVWHDRAVFHFLTDVESRRRYAATAARTLRPGGFALVATFSPHGPTRCSGLDVMRYDAEGLARELGADFELERSLDDVHRTPAGISQAFTYAVLRRR